MAYSPNSNLCKTLTYLATTLSNVTAFRTWTGTATPTLALAKINYVVAEEASWSRPGVCLWVEPGYAWQARGYTNGDDFSVDATGSILVRFEADASSTYTTTQDQAMHFLDSVSSVIEGLLALSGSGTYTTLSAAAVADYSSRTDAGQGRGGDYFSWTWRLSL